MEEQQDHHQIPLVLLLGIYFYGLSTLIIKGITFALEFIFSYNSQ